MRGFVNRLRWDLRRRRALGLGIVLLGGGDSHVR